MKIYGIGTIEKTEENKKWYNHDDYKMTGETIEMGSDGEKTTYVVFTGDWTRSYTIRDCGDHYIYAGYSAYYRIDKATLEITKDVEDR